MQVSIIILRHPHADKPSCPAQRPRRFAQDTGGARRLDLEPSQAWQFPAHRLKNVASRPPKRPIMIVADERNWTCDLPDVGQISLIHSRRFIALVRASTAPNRLRQKANFVCGFKLIGISSPWPKNICFRKSEIVVSSAHPAPTRGALAIVTNVGRDAVDAAARRAELVAGQVFACERSGSRKTSGAGCGRKAVWSWHPLLVSSQRRCAKPERAGKTLIRWRR